MCAASPQAQQSPPPPSALKQTSADAAGSPSGRYSPCPSPSKRVSFALPPAPADSPALSAAAALLQGGGSSGRATPARRLPRLAVSSPATQAFFSEDEFLTFIPQVDSPRATAASRLSPLAAPGLGACRRWPSNEVS